jgi:hypothetical protein
LRFDLRLTAQRYRYLAAAPRLPLATTALDNPNATRSGCGDPAVVAIDDDGALEHAVLAALHRAGRPLTCAALAEAVGQRDVGIAVVRLAAAQRLRRTRKGWAPRRPSTPPEVAEHDTARRP